MTTTTIDLPPLRRAAELTPASIDEAARTVTVVWSTGARVRRVTLLGQSYDEELSLEPGHVRLDRLNAGAPFVQVHRLTSLDAVIGSVVPGSARIEDGRGIAQVRISEREDVEPIWQDIKAGHIRAVSIGYVVHRYDVERSEGERELWRAVDWTPIEISAVPVGADPEACIRGVPASEPCVVNRAAIAGGSEVAASRKTAASNSVAATRNDHNVEGTGMNDSTEVETRAAPVAVDEAAIAAAEARAREAERERVATIYDLASRLRLERAVADELVRSGVSLDEARREILDRVAAQADERIVFPHVSTPLGGLDETETRRSAIVGALLHRYSPEIYRLDDAARQYRGMSLLELARECLNAAGVNTRGMTRDEVATRAMHSTSDFPFILENVATKSLRQAYEAYPTTFRPFCRRVSAPDFKPISRVQLGEAPDLVKVPEGGEFTRGSIGEAVERYKLETYGRVISITRQVIINDDLDAFSRVPARIGNAMAKLESNVVWGIITGNPVMNDGVQLFAASHNNLAGTGAALSVTSLGAGRAALANQKGLDNDTPLNVIPQFLLVPVELATAAEQLVSQTIVPSQPSNAVPEFIRSLRVIPEPRLGAASLTAWYLAATPDQIDTIEYAYLDGQEGGTIETRNGFDIDGVEIKVRLDFGAKAIDWRGFYKNPGA